VSQDNDRSEAFSLLGEVIRLRADVASIGRKTFRSWLPRTERIEFVASALNLAHYLILRRRDLRPMQRRLMVLGLSSLGRAEGRVLASLDAVMVALASLAAPDVPAGEPAFPSPLLSRGEAAPGKYGSSFRTSTWSASGAYYGDSRGRGSR